MSGLYSEGTLLRHCSGGLWIVLGYCKNPYFPTKMPNAYDVVSVECGFRYTPVFRLVHSDFEVVSEG